jgi:solute carrier family 39 (zinc transporter), member 1/2/3
MTHSNLMFANPCIGELAYEATASAITMAGIFLSFLIDYLGQRYLQFRTKGKQETESGTEGTESDTLKVAILEGGIIFHSLRTSSSTPNAT